MERKGFLREDELPGDITEIEYSRWFNTSTVIDNVRIGLPPLRLSRSQYLEKNFCGIWVRNERDLMLMVDWLKSSTKPGSEEETLKSKVREEINNRVDPKDNIIDAALFWGANQHLFTPEENDAVIGELLADIKKFKKDLREGNIKR